MKYIIKCELLNNAIRFGLSLVPLQHLLDSLLGSCLLTSGTIAMTVVTICA
jgi:hypothetical protein